MLLLDVVYFQCIMWIINYVITTSCHWFGGNIVEIDP